MFPYIFLSIFSGACSVFYRRKYDPLIGDFIFLVLLSLVCLRGGGFGLADYQNYKRFYELVLSWGDVINPSVPAEIGFRFFSFLGNALDFEPQFIIMIMGVLSVLPVYFLIRKASEYKVLAIFFWLPYFFTFNMQTSRTSVAASFGVLFLYFLFKRNYFSSFLFFIIAFSFHKSSLVLLMVVLTYLNINILLALTLSLFVLLFFFSPLDLAVYIFEKAGLIGFNSKIISYKESLFGHSMALYDPRILISLFVSILGFRIKDKLTSFEAFYLKLFVIGTIILIAFSEMVIIAWRGSYYFLLNGVIVVPFVAKYYNVMLFRGSNVKMVLSLLVLLGYGTYLTWLIYNGEPFKFFFS